jgi:hypothetical protein
MVKSSKVYRPFLKIKNYIAFNYDFNRNNLIEATGKRVNLGNLQGPR